MANNNGLVKLKRERNKLLMQKKELLMKQARIDKLNEEERKLINDIKRLKISARITNSKIISEGISLGKEAKRTLKPFAKKTISFLDRITGPTGTQLRRRRKRKTKTTKRRKK